MDIQEKIRTLRLQVVYSTKCNLNCFYCCKEGAKTNYSLLNDENIINIIRACKDTLNIERIKYTGGEPLLYGEGIINIMDKINKTYNTKSNSIEQSIVTNGTNTELIEKIIDKNYKLDFTISLPSINYETFRSITRASDAECKFKSILNSINLICQKNIPLKINCVLVNGFNTSYDELKGIIDKFKNMPNVKLRFLQMVRNKINKLDENYITSDLNFDNVMNKLGFNKIEEEKRSSSTYTKQNMKIKLIKSFCDKKCTKCPEDKTSLWITSEGTIKKCCYDNRTEQEIKDWTYECLCRELFEFYSS